MSHLLPVQVLRGLAALSVAMLHAQHDAAALAGSAWAPLDRVPWAAGVDVFFVISGFIMVHSSRESFGEEGAWREFLARRIARIVPLYWAATSLYLAIAILNPGMVNGEVLGLWPVLASYLFIPFERPNGLVQPLYSLGWTLNYEMFFYTIFALAIGLPYRRALATLVGGLAALVALGLVARWPQPVAFWTSPILLEFIFGLILGGLRLAGLRVGRPVQGLLAAAGLALLALDLTPSGGAVAVERVLAWGLPAALLVAGAALGREGAWAQTVATRFGAALGDASYALYLLHPFVIRALLQVALAGGLGALIGPWGFVALSLAAAVLASLAVHRVFERPLTGRVRRWLVPGLPARA